MMCCVKNFFLIFLIILIGFVNCEKSYEPIEKYSDQQVIIIEDLPNFELDSIHIDSFSINNVRVDEVADVIIFEVSYAGGCKDHQFKLYGTHGILYSNPPGCYVHLSHNGNNDNCEAMITETISFSLKPYIDAGYDALILHIRGYNGEDFGTIWYRK